MARSPTTWGMASSASVASPVGHVVIRMAALMARRACVVALAFQCFSGSPGLQAVASQDEGSGIAEIAAGGDEEDT